MRHLLGPETGTTREILESSDYSSTFGPTGTPLATAVADTLEWDRMRQPSYEYEDRASGKADDRPGLAACLKSLRERDILVVWRLDRLGRNLHHLVTTVHDPTTRGVGLKFLTGQGAAIDTPTPAGKLVFGTFAALAEYERALISERTLAGLAPPGPGTVTAATRKK